MSSSDHYSTLGVPPTATPTEIKARFRFLSHAYHPDKFGSAAHRQTAEEDFKRINAAYQILSDPQARADFDSQRSGKSTPPPLKPNPPPWPTPPPLHKQQPPTLQAVSRASLWTACLWALAFTCTYFSAWGIYVSGYALVRSQFVFFYFMAVATALLSWGAASLFRRGRNRLRIDPSRLYLLFEIPLSVILPIFIYTFFVGPTEPAATHALVRAFVFSGIAYAGIFYLRRRAI
jgi:hypothetical protein